MRGWWSVEGVVVIVAVWASGRGAGEQWAGFVTSHREREGREVYMFGVRGH